MKSISVKVSINITSWCCSLNISNFLLIFWNEKKDLVSSEEGDKHIYLKCEVLFLCLHLKQLYFKIMTFYKLLSDRST